MEAAVTRVIQKARIHGQSLGGVRTSIAISAKKMAHKAGLSKPEKEQG
jgi:hypothetical protein